MFNVLKFEKCCLRYKKVIIIHYSKVRISNVDIYIDTINVCDIHDRLLCNLDIGDVRYNQASVYANVGSDMLINP